MPGPLHRLAILPLLDALGRLSAETAERAGAALGLLVFALGVRRGVVSANLARALGLTGTRRRRIARRSYASIGAQMLSLWTVGRPESAPEHGLRVLNPLWLERMRRRHHASVWLTLHIGNWDVTAYTLSVGGRVIVYAKRQHDLAVDAVINRQRNRLGMEVVLARQGDRTGAVTVLRGLRAGAAIGLLADQKPSGNEGEPAYFLGVPTRCHSGPVFFARRAGVPLVPMFSLRRRAGEYVVFCGRPFAPAADEAVAVQAAMDRLSAIIAAFPGQYFWHHRRFKRPIDLPVRAMEPWRERGLRLLVDRD